MKCQFEMETEGKMEPETCDVEATTVWRGSQLCEDHAEWMEENCGEYMAEASSPYTECPYCAEDPCQCVEATDEPDFDFGSE